MEGINWTNWIIASSAAISAISTVALAIITYRYVRLTRKILSNAQEPRVQIYPVANATSPLLHVENIGMGVARDLRFSSSYKLSDGRLLVESEYFLKNGIRFLLPKEIKVVSMGDWSDWEKLQKQLKICVTYIDSENEDYSFPFCIDLNEYWS